MGLDKAIKYGKEKRKPYIGAQAVCSSCRNHGGCPYCEGNRKYKFRDRHPALKEELDDNSIIGVNNYYDEKLMDYESIMEREARNV